MNSNESTRQLKDKIIQLEKQITSLKHAETAFKKERDFISELLYWIDSLVVVVDLKGRVVSFNKASEQLSGYRFEEFENTPFWEILISPEEREAVRSAITDVIRKGMEKTFQNYWVTKSGKTRLISWTNSTLRRPDGSIEYILCTGMDITEQTQAETALRKSEAQYRELVQSANSIIIRMDKNGTLIFINDFGEKFFGYAKGELIGQNSVGTIVPKTDSNGQNLSSLIKEVCENPKRYASTVNENICKNGQRVWLTWTNKVILDPDGEVVELLCIGNDNTEQNRLEKQLQRAQKMEAVGMLAGGVAHDLNNILSGVISYPELLLMDLDQQSPLREPIIKIKDSGQKAAAIVQDLLTLARRGVAINEVVNLNHVIAEFRKTHEFENLEQNYPEVNIVFDLEPRLLNISGSPVHLVKTIMNLILNAAEAISGPGDIRVVTENRYIDRPVPGYEDVQEGDYVKLSVKDSGIGIPSNDLARIFEPFFTQKVMGRSGTGLGMAVVWGTVKDHKGYIDVQSTMGRGTSCYLFIPVTRRALEEKQVEISLEQCRGSETILVVDDMEEQREIACELLSRLGYTVSPVPSGEDAVTYLETKTVDLVVLDMIMTPGIDGLETYRQIIDRHPGQKAIVTSGYSKTERVKETLRLGASVYLKKPYVMENLSLAVRAALDA